MHKSAVQCTNYSNNRNLVKKEAHLDTKQEKRFYQEGLGVLDRSWTPGEPPDRSGHVWIRSFLINFECFGGTNDFAKDD